MSQDDLRAGHAADLSEGAVAAEVAIARPERPSRVAPELRGMGERMRNRRQEKGLSLRDLSERVGVSASLISQVETGRASPSVATLYAMATELEMSVDDALFGSGASPDVDEPDSAHPVRLAADRKAIRLASGVTWELLTNHPDPEIEFKHVTYDVGGSSGPGATFQRHAGREWGYVMSGRLNVAIGFQEYVLESGDSIAIDSMVPHRLWNDGDEPVHGIWFVLGRHEGDRASVAGGATPDGRGRS